MVNEFQHKFGYPSRRLVKIGVIGSPFKGGAGVPGTA